MAGFSQNEVDALGELGVVGVFTFEQVKRDDTAKYTCTATNSLSQTTTLDIMSDPIQLTVLGKLPCGGGESHEGHILSIIIVRSHPCRGS